MTDTRITGLSTTYDRDDYSRTVDYLIGDRSGGSSFRILAEEAVLGVLESVTGNVGIGTTSPGAKLDVDGAARFGDAGVAQIGSATASGDLKAGANLLMVANAGNDNLNILPSGSGAAGSYVTIAARNGSAWRSVFETANVASGEPNAILLKNGGNVGIGKTPSALLDIEASADGDLFAIYNSAGAQVAKIANNIYPRLEIQDFDSGASRGPNIVLGRNSNASTPAPGHILMRRADASAYQSIYPDNSGVWRTLATGPISSTFASGTVIGAQTSMAATKNIYADLSSLADVAERIRAGAEAVRKFAYKSGAFNGQEFEGVVVDEAPEYGMDRDAEHPAGKSLNEIQIIGDLLRMVADLSKRVAELEMK